MKKPSRPALIGLLLVGIAGVLVLAGKGCADDDPGGAAGATSSSQARSESGGDSRPLATKRPGSSRRTSDAEPREATELKLLWARGRESELLPALDEIATMEDPDDWRAVSDILIAQASTEGRHEVIDYLLAAGDAAPADIRLAIYAAALDNSDEVARETAQLELQNLTGEVFESGDAARSWIAAHPEALREPEAEE
jgi:hypothetical protein